MAVYSYTRTEGAFGHGLATIDSDKGINSFEYEDLGELNGKHYIYTQATSKKIPSQPNDINFTKDSLPENLLNKYKKLKRDRISELSHQFDGEMINQNMKISSSLGFIANADIRSQNNLRALIDITSDDETVTYMDYDAIPHELTLDDLKTLLKEIILNGNYLYQQKWSKYNSIDSANTYDELAQVDENFEMKDFMLKDIV